MLFLSSLDIDWRRLDNGIVWSSDKVLEKVLSVVSGCSDNSMVSYRRSPSGNGFHVRLLCGVNCDLCRMVFDSPLRWGLDQLRPEVTQGVLWDEKWYYKGGSGVRMEAGPWFEGGE